MLIRPFVTDMGMKDPVPTFKALVERIDSKYKGLAYIHIIEPDLQYPPPAAPGVEIVATCKNIKEPLE